MKSLRKHLIAITVTSVLGATAMVAAADPDTLSKRVVFDIGAQPLPDALSELAKQSGLQIVFAAPIGKGLTSSGLHGSYSPEQGLRKMLEGTNLEYAFIKEDTIAVRERGKDTPGLTSLDANREIRVAQAESSTTAAGAHSNPATKTAKEPRQDALEEVTVFGRGFQESTREVPRSVTVFDGEILKMIAGTTVADVIRLLPSSSNLIGEASFISNFNVRGAEVSYTRNGMIPGPTAPLQYDLANVERVEVLMGPSSITYGSMSPGAVVNIVTKQPTSQFQSQFKVQAGSFDTYGGSVDIGGPLGDRVRARLNASYLDKGQPFDHWEAKTTLLAPVLDFDLTDRTLLTIEGTYRSLDAPGGWYDGRISAVGTLLPGPAGQIPLSVNPSYFTGISRFTERYQDANLRLRHEFSESLTLNGQITYGDTQYRELDGISNGAPLSADGRTLSRSFYNEDSGAETLVAAMNLAATFHTGRLAHKLITGIDYIDDRNRANVAIFGPTAEPVPDLDVFNPDYSVAVPLGLTYLWTQRRTSKTSAVFLQDAMSIGSRLSLLAGIRYTDYDSDATRFYPDGRVLPRPPTTAKEWSPQLGVLYKVSDSLSFYANRSTSFAPRQAVQLRSGDFYTEPSTAVQYEIGSQASIPGSTLVVSLAAFHIAQPDVLTFDPVDIAYQIPAGELVSKGIEAKVSGSILPGWRMLASYGYNPTEVTKSFVPGEEGLSFQNSPRHTWSLITGYDFTAGPLRGFGLSASASHLGGKYADATNVLTLPASTRVDMGVHYRIGDSVEVGVQINNLTDEEIWNGFSPDFVARNPGRNYLVQVTFTPMTSR